MPFHNTINPFSVQTTSHCDNFNEVNTKLFENTMWNHQLIEDLCLTVDRISINVVDEVPQQKQNNQIFFVRV